MAHDLSRAIFNELDPISPVVHEADHITRNLDNRAMLSARNVESLSVNHIVRRLQDQVNGTTCIVDVEKIASSLSIPVNRELLVENDTSDESRNDFLQMLHWSKIIEWPNDHRRNSIRCPIREHQSIGPAFGACIGAHGVQCVLLSHRLLGGVPIHLGTRDVNESLDFASRLDDCIRNRLGSKHVGLKEQQTVEDRTSNVGLGRKMDDDVSFFD